MAVSDVDDLRSERYPQFHTFGIEQIPFLEDLRFEGSIAALNSCEHASFSWYRTGSVNPRALSSSHIHAKVHAEALRGSATATEFAATGSSRRSPVTGVIKQRLQN